MLIPVYNLEIGKALQNELKIGNVTFMSSSKIPRVRKRLGFPYKVSHYSKVFRDKLLTRANTYAITKISKNDTKDVDKQFTDIRTAIEILQSSQFFRIKRDYRIPFGSPYTEHSILDEYLQIEHNPKTTKASWMDLKIGKIQPYRIDKTWKEFIKNHFFLDLLKLINNKSKIKEGWKNKIIKASQLAGKSQFATEIHEAFLFNVIALDSLLILNNEKIPSELWKKRLFSLFGWLYNEDEETIEKVVEILYKKRCELVHEGHFADINELDLTNSDNLLSNLIRNLCLLRNNITKQEDLINLSEKIWARKILSLKPKERPKKLVFSSSPFHPKKKLRRTWFDKWI